MPAERSLSVIVDKHRSQIAIRTLREEGVYDDSRSIYEAGSEAVAIPVTEPPCETSILEVVEESGEPRLQTLEDHLTDRGWSDEAIERAPSSWAVIGSVILVDASGVPSPTELGEALLAMHGQADTVLDRGPISGPHREPSTTVIAGEGDTETVHREHGTTYAMDLAEVMFSPGNKEERVRMTNLVEPGERVLDMFAGIGYFTLGMARAGATVTAVERNPTAFQYLIENVMQNDVTESVETYRSDCRDVITALTKHATGPQAADNVADAGFDRIVMGYYDAYEYLDFALLVLNEGGVVHMHEATPETLVPERPTERLHQAAQDQGVDLEVLAVRTVKGYSEGVVHVVVDARRRDNR